MEQYNGILCATLEDLQNIGMKVDTIRRMAGRGTIERVRRGCRGCTALYSVNSLPYEVRQELYRQQGNPQEESGDSAFIKSLSLDGDAVKYYFDFRFDDGTHLYEQDQIKYANTASLLNAMIKWRAESDALRSRLDKKPLSLTQIMNFMAGELEKLSNKGEFTPHNLPASSRSLRRRYEAYVEAREQSKSEGYQALLYKGYRNSNNKKVFSEEQNDIMLRLLSHGNNLDNVQIANLYNSIGETQGWKKIVPRTVSSFREKMSFSTSGGQKGATEFRNTRTMQIKRTRPTAPFYYWTLDGWDVELLYQYSKNGVTYFNGRLVLEVILDPFNNYPIGYAIGEIENKDLIKSALRNAVKHSEELFGVMVRPHQLQSDHFGMKGLRPLYEDLAKYFTPARVKNAKSKVVEPYFKHLNKTYCQMCSNWSGHGVKAKRQPNVERLNKIKKDFPTKEALIEAIHRMMAIERGQKVQQFMEAWEGVPAERKLTMSRELYLAHFGETTGRLNTLSHNGLNATLLGKLRNYDCFDLRMREHSHLKWELRYDPENLSEVLAVSEDSSQRFVLQEKYVQPMAIVERTEEDVKALQRVNDFNKAMEQTVVKRLALAEERTEHLILPQHQGLLGRLMITEKRKTWRQ